MLSPEEILVLESLLERARQAASRDAPAGGDIRVGDVVQLRPGADPHWETSLLLVGKVREDGGIAGSILRPHRGGWKDAWYVYRPPEVCLIGHAPFAESSLRVRGAGYWPVCPSCHNLERKPVCREMRQPKKGVL